MTPSHPRLAYATAVLVAVVGVSGVLSLAALAAPGAAADVAADAPRDVEVLAKVVERPEPPEASPSPSTSTATAMTSAVPAPSAGLPTGKGMWIWQPERVEGGDVARMVARARLAGLTHVYVRTGSSRMGFYAAELLDRVLPAAHDAGLAVYGWDFPYFYDVADDIARSVAAIRHTAPGGHRLDGFVPDIETVHEGTRITAEAVTAFGAGLRAAVGPDYPLIAAVPRPSPARIADYPYAEVLADMDGVAPMVYWLNRQPDSDVAGAIDFLSQFGKPVLPIGQAYDGGPEGGRPGVPPRDELLRFMDTAAARGARAVSFWSWQHADEQAWAAISGADHFTVADLLPLLLLPAGA